MKTEHKPFYKPRMKTVTQVQVFEQEDRCDCSLEGETGTLEIRETIISFIYERCQLWIEFVHTTCGKIRDREIKKW